MKTTPDIAVTRIENLDVRGLDQELNIGSTKGGAGESAQPPLLSSLGARTARPSQRREHRRQYRPGGTKYITALQAANIIEAAAFAKSIGLPLVAHLTIHWAYTNAGDDPVGKLFAKFREGLDKWMGRQGIVFFAPQARPMSGPTRTAISGSGLQSRRSPRRRVSQSWASITMQR